MSTFLLGRLWNRLPGKTFAEKVFRWDLYRTILVFLQLFLLSAPFQGAFDRVSAQAQNPQANLANGNDATVFLVWNAANEFLTSDTFGWDDILYLFHQTAGLRFIFGYLFFIPLFLFIDYRWARRNSALAMRLRTFSLFIIVFIMFLGIVSPSPNYDVYIDVQLLTRWNWASWLLLLSLVQLSALWCGVFITTYLVNKAWSPSLSRRLVHLVTRKQSSTETRVMRSLPKQHGNDKKPYSQFKA